MSKLCTCTRAKTRNDPRVRETAVHVRDGLVITFRGFFGPVFIRPLFAYVHASEVKKRVRETAVHVRDGLVITFRGFFGPVFIRPFAYVHASEDKKRSASARNGCPCVRRSRHNLRGFFGPVFFIQITFPNVSAQVRKWNRVSTKIDEQLTFCTIGDSDSGSDTSFIHS
jgi:hypothetical protein